MYRLFADVYMAVFKVDPQLTVVKDRRGGFRITDFEGSQFNPGDELVHFYGRAYEIGKRRVERNGFQIGFLQYGYNRGFCELYYPTH